MPAYSARLLYVMICFAMLLPLAINAAPQTTHGISSGDVTATSAVIWSKADRIAKMWVEYQPMTGSHAAFTAHRVNNAANDYTAQINIEGLKPGTTYRYDVWFEDHSGVSDKTTGIFTTAPLANQRAQVSLLWGGDLAGQTYCRQESVGYTIFEAMTKMDTDFYVANGDMIYADNACPRKGPLKGWVNVPGNFPGISDNSVDWLDISQVQEVYYQHWRYNRSDLPFQKFLQSTSQYVQWDDHEVINDFGAAWADYPAQPNRAGYPNIVTAGLKSLFDYHPMARHPTESDRIYRSYRWGLNAELFILDARSYRSKNTSQDSTAKTMLGPKQLSWLKKGLSRSKATWKIISNDVPLSIPTGSGAISLGRDAFADGKNPFTAAANPGLASTTGFELELLNLLKYLDKKDVSNIVFIATDVHFAAQLRYEQDFDGDQDTLLFHELVSGPLSAVRNPAPPALDPTLHPVVLYAEGDIFNFGTINIDAGTQPVLHSDIRDENGKMRPGSDLLLAPQ